MIVTAPKKVINGWAMYDWANSVYNLVITTTFFPIYFLASTQHHFKSTNIPFLGRTFDNGALYSFSLAAAYLIISIFYPILTSIADNRMITQDFFSRRWEAVARAEDFVRLLNRSEPPPGW